MSTEPFIGEVKLFGFDFAPRGYATCEGQIMQIRSNTALFALLGTTYGGDGVNTFALPDLRGRAPIGQGQGPGLPPFDMGEFGGTTTRTLLTTNIPMHIHTLSAAKVNILASNANAEEQTPQDTYPATTTDPAYSSVPETGVYTGRAILSGTTDITGGSEPFSILNPYLCMNYSIALLGIFPSRN